MPDSFTDVLDRIEGEVRDVRETFNPRDDGARISLLRRPQQRNIVEYKKKLLAATRIIREVQSGMRSMHFLQEVMSTDDFPLYFADILDRQMLARYREWPVTWVAYAKRSVVRDFRTAKLILPVYGADGPLDEVKEGAPYPDAHLSEQAPIEWNVEKYGRRIPFTWETLVNDDLDMLSDMPERLARAARRTEQRLVTQLFVGASGPNTDMYSNTYGNIVNTTNGGISSVGNNPALSINALQSALVVLSKATDETGEPILRDMLTLVVPPALEITARTIMNATTIFDSSLLGGGQPDNNSTSGERILQVDNWMRNRLRLVVDPYIPTYASSANGNTSWFLFADPNEGREAIRIGFLRGHETPEIWMKSPNAVRVGGGDVSPFSGDFDTDSVEYRVRHVTGVVRVDPKSTVMSNGSGS